MAPLQDERTLLLSNGFDHMPSSRSSRICWTHSMTGWAKLSWSNVEIFDRDVHIQFPPIDFRNLRYTIEQATVAEVDKLITFD